MNYPSIDISATGKHIETLMKIHSCSVKDLQMHLGLSAPQAIYKWLRGAALPSIDNLFALSKLFDTPIDKILVSTQTEGKPNEPPIAQQPTNPANTPFLYCCLAIQAA